MGLVVLVKKMLVLINFLLQNTNLVSVLRKIPILCQSLEKYQSCVSPQKNANLVSVLRKIPILCQSLEKYQSCVSPQQNLPQFCWSCLTGLTHFANSDLASVVCHRLNFYITISFGWSSSKIVSGGLSQHPRSPPLRLKVEKF